MLPMHLRPAASYAHSLSAYLSKKTIALVADGKAVREPKANNTVVDNGLPNRVKLRSERLIANDLGAFFFHVSSVLDRDQISNY
jgi:hypothetical protein